MRAYLHPDFALSGNTLRDRYLDARYKLSPDAVWLARRLGRDNQLEQLVGAVTQKGLSAREAQAAIFGFYMQLARLGALRAVWGNDYSSLVRLRMAAGWNHRYKATMGGFCRAMLRAYAVPALLGTGLFLVPLRAGVLPTESLVLPISLFMTLVIHEAGHACAARLLGARAVLVAHTGYSAVVYVSPVGVPAKIIAATGPLAGSIACGIGGFVTPYGWMYVLLALGHIFCLLPWTADGRTLWRATQRQRNR